MQRRSFITLLGGAAAAWPLAAGAQQRERMRRIGWLIAGAENDPGARANRAALQEALAKLGWVEGRNLRIDVRFGAGDPDGTRAYAAELTGQAPDVIVTSAGAATEAMQHQTQTIPIVFTGGGDAVAAGLVRNIARPHPAWREAFRPASTGEVKYETVLNLKTAKARGLDVPATVPVRADEVIE